MTPDHRDAEYAVTRALRDSQHEADAIPRVLAAIGEARDWTVGAYWRVDADAGVLACVYAWHTDAKQAADYLEANQRFRLKKGEGLPGRVWQSEEPVWISDVHADDNFPRIGIAAAHDLRSGVGFPVFVGREVVGVLEFFTTESMAADEPFMRVLAGIGSEVGQFIRRSQAEHKLRESEQRFRTLAETATDAIITINRQSVIQYANPATEKLFGYQADELIGKSLVELMPVRMRGAHEAGIARYLRTGKRNIPWSGVQLPALHKSGREIPVEVSFGEFALGGDRAFTGIIRDVTDRVREQEMLEQRTSEAESAARAKSDFLAAMSHELRTPLQAVIGYAGLLDAGVHGQLTDQQRESIERIQASASHLLTLIDQVLDVTRAEDGRLRLRSERINLCEVVADAAELVRPQAESKGLELTIAPCDDQRMLDYVGDAARIRQIVLNLLSNAVKFTAKGSVSVSFEATESNALISVTDTGPGIAAEQLDRVFEKFYQTAVGLSQRQPGMGLGLSISRDLARSMGGDIQVESRPNEGSRFTLALPLASPGSARSPH